MCVYTEIEILIIIDYVRPGLMSIVLSGSGDIGSDSLQNFSLSPFPSRTPCLTPGYKKKIQS